MKNKELFLIRGIPGSGKSTLAKSLSNGAGSIYVEADMYFIKDGEYKFDSSKIKNAHEWCVNKVEQAMMGVGYSIPQHTIIVSNTFTKEWEMENYFKLAEKYNYRVYSLIVENRHNGINTHSVPNETLEKMRKRFEIKL